MTRPSSTRIQTATVISKEGGPVVPADPIRSVLTVAWLSVALGLAIELILLLIAAGAGTFARIQPFYADAVQKVAWSVFVCVGLSFGQFASKFRPQLTGALGLLAAPVGFTVARILHKAAESTLGLISNAAAGPSPLTMAFTRGLEYGVLGFALGVLSKRRATSPLAFASVGLAAGLVFGGLIAGVINPQPLSGVGLATRMVNELLFPIGCALVVYAAEALPGRMKVS